MKIYEIVLNTVREYLIENDQLINNILDKINKVGKENLSQDEKTYLNQYNKNIVNKDLENWLLNDDEDLLDITGKKILYDEFDEDEDIFYNIDKLKRVITKHIGKKPYTNNADWGGAYVWNIKSNDGFTGLFFYLDDEDEDLVILKRTLIDDEYNDEIIKTIRNTKDLYRSILDYKKK